MIYIKITSDVDYDAIYYTLDGTNPTRDSQVYDKPFPVYNDCEIRAIAVKDEWIDSDVSILKVEVSSATPEIARTEGTASDNCFIEIVNEADYEGAEDIRFYYTLDGTEPNEGSDSFALGGRLNIKENCTVKLISGGPKSAPSVGVVQIEINDLKCQTPSISTYYDTISKTVRATISSSTENAEIFYTIDGSNPGNESYKYAGEFSIDHNCILKAVADTDTLLMSDITESNIVSFLTTPSLVFEQEDKTIRISNLGAYNLEEVQFYYTTNGINPSVNSNLYNQLEGIKASGGSTVKVIAIGLQGVSSDIASIEVPYIYHTVMFNSDGGTSVDYQSIREGAYAVEPESPTKEGYIFQYWYLDSSENPYDFNTPVLEDITLTALWTEDQTEPPVDEGTLAIVGKARVGKARVGKAE